MPASPARGSRPSKPPGFCSELALPSSQKAIFNTRTLPRRKPLWALVCPQLGLFVTKPEVPQGEQVCREQGPRHRPGMPPNHTATHWTCALPAKGTALLPASSAALVTYTGAAATLEMGQPPERCSCTERGLLDSSSWGASRPGPPSPARALGHGAGRGLAFRPRGLPSRLRPHTQTPRGPHKLPSRHWGLPVQPRLLPTSHPPEVPVTTADRHRTSLGPPTVWAQGRKFTHNWLSLMSPQVPDGPLSMTTGNAWTTCVLARLAVPASLRSLLSPPCPRDVCGSPPLCHRHEVRAQALPSPQVPKAAGGSSKW